MPIERASFCGSCPFSVPQYAEDEGTGSGGIDEYEFDCLLLGRDEVRRRNRDTDAWRDPEFVWGENPLCTDADWARHTAPEGLA